MKNSKKNLKKVISKGLIGIICLTPTISSGCRSIPNRYNRTLQLIEGLPTSYLAQSSIEALSDPQLIEEFNKLFPNNKPELSYKIGNGRYKSKVFLHPKARFSGKRHYEFLGGIEITY
jgi:hypothetical protein